MSLATNLNCQPDDHWNGAYYNEHSKAQQTCAHECLENVHFVGNERILDVGCGDGKITAEIAKYVPNGYVVGIDNSPSMIEFSQNAFLTDSQSNLSFEVKSAERLNYRNEFDLVVSFSCLHWVKDQLAALEGIRRSLVPGGKAIILTYPQCYYWEFLDELVNTPRWIKYFLNYESPLAVFTAEQYAWMLKTAGLYPKRISTVRTIDEYESRQAYLDFMRGWLPHLNQLPKYMHDAFLNDYADKEFEYVGISGHGKIELPYIRMDIEAIA